MIGNTIILNIFPDTLYMKLQPHRVAAVVCFQRVKQRRENTYMDDWLFNGDYEIMIYN